MESFRVVPQRLFANWEMDRASSASVQRVFTLSISRMCLFPLPSQLRSFVLTAKLEGYKRTLRSNEMPLSNESGALDIPLDISFTIQYPHFLKHKRNVVEILVQRRRQYKNRPIPGGFKTIALGAVDVSAILQSGGFSQKADITLYVLPHRRSKQSSPSQLTCMGRLTLSNCTSQPLDVENETRGQNNSNAKEKEHSGDDSEDTEEEDGALEEEGGSAMPSARSDAPTTGRDMRESQRRRKRAQRKNIKQRLTNLLRKFRVPDDEGEALPGAPSSVAREPTATELQALFDELDDMSDSGNEGAVAADQVSIVSNPRPALRPFFSKEQLMPSIYDYRGSESEGEDLEWSSETEGTAAPHVSSNTQGELTREGGLAALPHSQTAGSIAVRDKTSSTRVARNASVNEHMFSLLSDPLPSISTRSSSRRFKEGGLECTWLCSAPDDLLSGLQQACQGMSPACQLRLTPTSRESRVFVQQIVNNIQNFCNSNSSPPPPTCIGILGGDRLVSHVLRAYVDALQHKSTSSWLSYLRFVLLVPPNSIIGRLLAGSSENDGNREQLSRDVWERWPSLSGAEQKAVTQSMASCLMACSRRVPLNLPIGEALLHLNEKSADQSENRVFVPFLAEVRVGSGEEEEGSQTNSARGVADPEVPSGVSVSSAASHLYSSPPSSPHTKTSSAGGHPNIAGSGTTAIATTQAPPTPDSREMQVEYWIASERNENIALPTPPLHHPSTPQGKKDNSKASLKTHFRTLVISRVPVSSQFLSFSFVKERKKDKMLQKLGMKNKQKAESDVCPVQISAVSRLLCSAISKHTSLNVTVDGMVYTDVRFFQTSSQWQTHVKHFPIALLPTSPIV